MHANAIQCILTVKQALTVQNRFSADWIITIGDSCSELIFHFLSLPLLERWLGSRAVSVLDSGAEGPGF